MHVTIFRLGLCNLLLFLDASDDSDAEAPDAWKLQGRRTEMKKPSKRGI
jgi:hypothetical protein